MKKQFILATTLTLLSTAILAAGSHSGGHGDSHNMATMEAHWESPKAAQMQVNPITANRQSIAQGSSIYQKNCASCHGANAMGDGPSATYLKPKPTNLRAMSGGHSDGDFAWKITNGRGAMPAWENILSETDVWHTVNYIQSLKTAKMDHKMSMPKEKGHHGHGGGHHSN